MKKHITIEAIWLCTDRKNMVRATGQWKSKKEDVKRFLGKSREIKITIKDNGVIFIIRTNEQPANVITQHIEI